VSTTVTELRQDFFSFLFGEGTGYVCIAHGPPTDTRRFFKQKFFHWPTERDHLTEYIESIAPDMNVWFCVNLFAKPERKKDEALIHNLVWADLDTCSPDIISPEPSVVIQSSPNRFQALWRLDHEVDPKIAEDYSRRIAYKYNQNGADPSGWDLTQLLRVPFTTNFKYDDRPLVILKPIANDHVEVQEFEQLQEIKLNDRVVEEDPPAELLDPNKIFTKYQAYLETGFYELFEIEPEGSDNWSTRLWKLINMAYEAGMETQEVFSVAVAAKCNKYERDRRPLSHLWKEVLKAKSLQEKVNQVAGTWEPLLMPDLVREEDRTGDTFIDRYHKWATDSTDAVEVFHDLSAAMLLSGILAGSLKLDLRYTTLVPNLWGLILGESTLTRKTTAMTMATSMLREVDADAVLATDGSAEGLLTGLSLRPTGKVSMFYKDEVSGFFDAINNKPYLAGMPETMTQLYDGNSYNRMLRKENIHIERPVFIFFGGGIRDKTYSLISDEYILSGFLPRFLVVSGVADLSRIQRTGPRTEQGFAERQSLVNELLDIREQYEVSGDMMVGGQRIALKDLPTESLINVKMTDDAWETYGDMETKMVTVAHNSYYAMLALPTFERLSRSMLKLAMLLAATRQEPVDGSITVEKRDIQNAAWYIQDWGQYSVQLLLNAGKSQALRLLEKIRSFIEANPGTIKSDLMRRFHLTSKEIKEVMQTLIDRGEVRFKKEGRGERFWIVS
jgi:hypothetical protein